MKVDGPSPKGRLLAAQVEEIQLSRGGDLTTNLLSAFGQSLKETRLTAWLGYLLSMQPETLMPLFGFRGRVMAIRLETRHEDGRSDILVETSLGLGVIEAKIGFTDASAQLGRYPARWRTMLTSAQAHSGRSAIRNVHWQQIADCLDKGARNSSPAYRFLVTQFNSHLKEHHMIKATESWEIYAREIAKPVSLELFFKGHMYTCPYEKQNKVQKAQYFAPYFVETIAKQHSGLSAGISYVAKVEQVFDSNTWSEFKDGVCKYRNKQWWNSHDTTMQKLRPETDRLWNKEHHGSILLLGGPRLAFNPPIRKDKLPGSKRFLGRRFFSFDELFAAWGSRSES